MKLLHTVTVAILLLTSPILAQSSDPYAQVEHQANLSAYKEFRSGFLQNVSDLSYAASCGVISESLIDLVYNYFGQTFTSWYLKIGYMDKDITKLTRDSRQAGKDIAASNGCAYWKDHPDNMIAMRNEVRSAMSWLASGAPFVHHSIPYVPY